MGFETFKSTIVHQHKYDYIYDHEFYSRFIQKIDHDQDFRHDNIPEAFFDTNLPKSYSSCAHSSKIMFPNSGNKRKGTRYSKKQTQTLNEAFYKLKGDTTFYINIDEARNLSTQTGLDERQVSKWFSNKRSLLRKKIVNNDQDRHLDECNSYDNNSNLNDHFIPFQ